MKLWEKGIPTDEKIDRFTVGSDRELDLALAKADVTGSMAHAQMLAEVGLIAASEAEALQLALEEIQADIAAGNFSIEADFEDVHSKIEFLLIEKTGEAGRKIHTARSRNDQVLTDVHLYLKEEITSLCSLTESLFALLMDKARAYENVLLPGYTHLQVAMPSSFGMWFSAYAESLIDDLRLLHAAYDIVDQNPLGSAAGYGSSFPIDRERTTELMGFSSLKINPVAAQMSRGKSEKSASFAMASIAGTLSKLSMDVCLYLSQNFDFVTLPAALTTGSSIMPHKKNPDVFELIRGKCNRIQALPYDITLLSNNLPSGYHRDFQLLKESLFPAIESLKSCLDMTVFALGDLGVNPDILDDPKYDYLFTVDALNEKVARGVPFRTAYQEVAAELESGIFASPKATRHTHVGSLNNLSLEKIEEKLRQTLAGWDRKS